VIRVVNILIMAAEPSINVFLREVTVLVYIWEGNYGVTGMGKICSCIHFIYRKRELGFGMVHEPLETS
jgi:hypothetical protein